MIAIRRIECGQEADWGALLKGAPGLADSVTLNAPPSSPALATDCLKQVAYKLAEENLGKDILTFQQEHDNLSEHERTRRKHSNARRLKQVVLGERSNVNAVCDAKFHFPQDPI